MRRSLAWSLCCQRSFVSSSSSSSTLTDEPVVVQLRVLGEVEHIPRPRSHRQAALVRPVGLDLLDQELHLPVLAEDLEAEVDGDVLTLPVLRPLAPVGEVTALAR